MNPSYQSLNADEVVRTISHLSRRICERFPDSGLFQISLHLQDIALKTKDTTEELDRPIYAVRIFTILLPLILVAGLIGTLISVEFAPEGLRFFELIQLLESAINDVVLIGAGVFFLFTLEVRMKRKRALSALHELRSAAHVIDMLQLTKDPGRILYRGDMTESSPDETLTAFELSRYLDYCSEMLSLVGKIGALYMQVFDDSVLISAVNEIESHTTGLSRKIWQKLMILHTAGQLEPRSMDGG